MRSVSPQPADLLLAIYLPVDRWARYVGFPPCLLHLARNVLRALP
jgi:hypothetical protein